MNESIHADYFFNQFRRIYDSLVEEYVYEKGENNYKMVDRLKKVGRNGQLYYTFYLPPKNRILFMERSLKRICKSYAFLIGSREEEEDCFVFLDKLLHSNIDSPYQASFCFFVQFFCRDYFEILGKGSPDLWTSFEEKKEYQVNVTKEGKMISCESINMNLLEATNTLLQILLMEKEQKQGPILGVRYIRKDY